MHLKREDGALGEIKQQHLLGVRCAPQCKVLWKCMHGCVCANVQVPCTAGDDVVVSLAGDHRTGKWHNGQQYFLNVSKRRDWSHRHTPIIVVGKSL